MVYLETTLLSGLFHKIVFRIFRILLLKQFNNTGIEPFYSFAWIYYVYLG